jgi:hypothetical protein
VRPDEIGGEFRQQLVPIGSLADEQGLEVPGLPWSEREPFAIARDRQHPGVEGDASDEPAAGGEADQGRPAGAGSERHDPVHRAASVGLRNAVVRAVGVEAFVDGFREGAAGLAEHGEAFAVDRGFRRQAVGEFGEDDVADAQGTIAPVGERGPATGAVPEPGQNHGIREPGSVGGMDRGGGGLDPASQVGGFGGFGGRGGAGEGGDQQGGQEDGDAEPGAHERRVSRGGGGVAGESGGGWPASGSIASGRRRRNRGRGAGRGRGRWRRGVRRCGRR